MTHKEIVSILNESIKEAIKKVRDIDYTQKQHNHFTGIYDNDMPLGDITEIEQHSLNSLYLKMVEKNLKDNIDPVNKYWIQAFKLYADFHGVQRSKMCEKCYGDVWMFLSMNQTNPKC